MSSDLSNFDLVFIPSLIFHFEFHNLHKIMMDSDELMERRGAFYIVSLWNSFSIYCYQRRYKRRQMMAQAWD